MYVDIKRQWILLINRCQQKLTKQHVFYLINTFVSSFKIFFSSKNGKILLTLSVSMLINKIIFIHNEFSRRTQYIYRVHMNSDLIYQKTLFHLCEAYRCAYMSWFFNTAKCSVWFIYTMMVFPQLPENQWENRFSKLKEFLFFSFRFNERRIIVCNIVSILITKITWKLATIFN